MEYQNQADRSGDQNNSSFINDETSRSQSEMAERLREMRTKLRHEMDKAMQVNQYANNQFSDESMQSPGAKQNQRNDAVFNNFGS